MIEQQTESSADQPSLRWAKTAPLATSAASPAAECMIEVTCGLPCAEEEEAEAEEEDAEAELPSAEKRRVLITLACIQQLGLGSGLGFGLGLRLGLGLGFGLGLGLGLGFGFGLACIRPSTTPRQAEESETPVTT